MLDSYRMHIVYCTMTGNEKISLLKDLVILLQKDIDLILQRPYLKELLVLVLTSDKPIADIVIVRILEMCNMYLT